MRKNQIPEITKNNSRSCRQFRWQSKDYEAQLVRVYVKCKPGSIEPVYPLVFRVFEANQNVTFYVHRLNSINQGNDFKLATYFLLGEAKEPQKDNLRALLGRYVILIIEPRMKNGRVIPVIVGFKFSTKELFAYNKVSNSGHCPYKGRAK
jgi:hypothetical protein